MTLVIATAVPPRRKSPRYCGHKNRDSRRDAHDRRLSQVALRIREELACGHSQTFGYEQADHRGDNNLSSVSHRGEYQRDTRDKSVRGTEDCRRRRDGIRVFNRLVLLHGGDASPSKNEAIAVKRDTSCARCRSEPSLISNRGDVRQLLLNF